MGLPYVYYCNDYINIRFCRNKWGITIFACGFMFTFDPTKYLTRKNGMQNSSNLWFIWGTAGIEGKSLFDSFWKDEVQAEEYLVCYISVPGVLSGHKENHTPGNDISFSNLLPDQAPRSRGLKGL